MFIGLRAEFIPNYIINVEQNFFKFTLFFWLNYSPKSMQHVNCPYLMPEILAQKPILQYPPTSLFTILRELRHNNIYFAMWEIPRGTLFQKNMPFGQPKPDFWVCLHHYSPYIRYIINHKSNKFHHWLME